MSRAKPLIFPLCSLFVVVAVGCVPMPESDPDLDPSISESGDESSEASSEESSDEGTPVVCPVGNGPTVQQDGASEQIWRAEDSPHVVPYDMTVTAEITIEACSVVQLGGGITVTIADGGSIVAEGDAGDGEIRFERNDPEDPWAAIRLIGGTMTLENTVVEGGGDPQNGAPHIAAAIVARGSNTATAPEGTLRVRNVVIEGSLSQAVRLQDNGAFTDDSENLVVTGSAGSPISAAFDGAGSIPSGEYTGNGDDRIILTDALNDSVTTDMTLHDRGVPYLVGAPDQLSDLRVDAGPGGLATLTIEPGVEMQFRPGAIMRIDPDGAEEDATGALVAVGTVDDPIVFTAASDDPVPGEWLGLVFGSYVAPATMLSHVRVEYAGGETTSGSNSCSYGNDDGINDAAIRILGVPLDAFITNTAIIASANHGIDRGWRDDFAVSFLDGGNEFDVALCRQTWSRTEAGVCPDPVPCE